MSRFNIRVQTSHAIIFLDFTFMAFWVRASDQFCDVVGLVLDVSQSFRLGFVGWHFHSARA